MGEHTMPSRNQSSGQHQPGKQFLDQTQEPKDRTSTYDAYHEAARRQSRQDPLQTRGR